MKTFLLTTAAVAVLGISAASAADMAARPYTKAPPPVPVVAAYNWSGFYLGVMGGYGWSDRVRVDGFTTQSSDVKGGFGGGTIGYNWQAPGSIWVWGLEVDAAAADMKYSEAGTFGVVAVFPYTFEDKIRSFGSVTGRVGVTSGAALFYAKGGYAWADNRVTLGFPATATVLSESKVHSGWTVGGGVEYMFAPNWSFKGEYMYADYGSKTYFAPPVGPGIELGMTTHTVKGGINYHFNWGGPVVAKY